MTQAARLGLHSGEAQKAFSKRMPSDAKRSLALFAEEVMPRLGG